MGRPKSIDTKPRDTLGYCASCGCERMVRKTSGDYCRKCANQARKTPEIVRFNEYANGAGVEPAHVPGLGPCLEWTGPLTKDGYGAFSLADGAHGKQIQAHIYGWMLSEGPIPQGQYVLHKCDNRRCILVAHLFLGTKRENNEDRHRKGREARGETHGWVTHPKSVPRGESSGMAVLTEVKVREIRHLRTEGRSISELAQRFSVAKGTIYQVVHRITWRHVLD